MKKHIMNVLLNNYLIKYEQHFITSKISKNIQIINKIIYK